jgi:hypothetical protein
MRAGLNIDDCRQKLLYDLVQTSPEKAVQDCVVLLKLYGFSGNGFVGIRKRWQALNKENRPNVKTTRKRRNNFSTDSTSDREK